MGILTLISPRGWAAIGLAVAIAAFAFLAKSLADAKTTIRTLEGEVAACGQRAAALEKQVKDTAEKEGKNYEAVEAKWRAQCGAAYDAGAKRLRNDAAAVAAGRYVPKPRPGAPGR